MQLRFSLLRRAYLVAGFLVLALIVGVTFRRVWSAGFFQDDWTYLARAAGILPAPYIPLRPLSQDVYWRVIYAACGSDPRAYAFSRFLLHLCSGLVVMQLARLLRATIATSVLAGALYLLSPLAFEALYWASGVTDLLANLGLLIAVMGILRGDRSGTILLIIGGLVNLASKETGWWLPVGGIVAWRCHNRREYLWVAGLLGVAAIVGVANTTRALRSDYVWTLQSVPWNFLRFGSWLIPRADDLIRVWEAHYPALVIGGCMWLMWATWGVIRWRHADRLPALAITFSVLGLVPVLGLAGHIVPRYMLPVQAGLAMTVAWAMRGRQNVRYAGILPTALAAIVTASCVDQFLDRTYPQGGPAHRMVRKEHLDRAIWEYMFSNGVRRDTGVALVCRPTDDVAIREFMLDVMGHTWGPKVVLGRDARVIVADREADIPTGTPVFQFGHWSLEYRGILKRGP